MYIGGLGMQHVANRSGSFLEPKTDQCLFTKLKVQWLRLKSVSWHLNAITAANDAVSLSTQSSLSIDCKSIAQGGGVGEEE